MPSGTRLTQMPQTAAVAAEPVTPRQISTVAVHPVLAGPIRCGTLPPMHTRRTTTA